jgi:hypothetical protein
MQKQKLTGQTKLVAYMTGNPLVDGLDDFERPPIMPEAEMLMENEGGEVAVSGGLRGA